VVPGPRRPRPARSIVPPAVCDTSKAVPIKGYAGEEAPSNCRECRSSCSFGHLTVSPNPTHGARIWIKKRKDTPIFTKMYFAWGCFSKNFLKMDLGKRSAEFTSRAQIPSVDVAFWPANEGYPAGIKRQTAESPLYGAMLRHLEPFGSVGRL
jgi:hypothetical protein